MITLPSSGPLGSTAAPLAATVVLQISPALAVGVGVAVLVVVLYVVAALARRAGRRLKARQAARGPQVAMPFAPAGPDTMIALGEPFARAGRTP